MEKSLEILQKMCQRVGAEIAGLAQFPVASGRFISEAHIRPLQRAHSTEAERPITVEHRIAFIGDTNAGKSTLIAVLAHGNLDNGKGRARLGLLRHRHEILSGRTSSVAVEPLVMIQEDPTSQDYVPLRLDSIESTDHLALTSQRLMLEAPKVLELFDLPGRPPRFHRSVLSTLTSLAAPDLVCLTVAANEIGEESVKEHLRLISALNLPLIVALAKVDLVPEYCPIAEHLKSLLPPSVPLIPISATTGEGVPQMIDYLTSIPALKKANFMFGGRENSLFVIENVKTCEDIGAVLKGTLIQGKIEVGPSPWFLGPSPLDGSFKEVQIASIHRLRLPVHQVDAGLMAAVALHTSASTFSADRGMVLVNSAEMAESLAITNRLELNDWTFVSGKAVDKETHGIMHLGSSRVSVKLTPKSGTTALLVEALDQSRFLCIPGMRIVLATGFSTIAGIIK